MSFKPFVFIGLGGSGGKTLRVIRHTLKEMLDSANWSGDFPAGWQFLHIDVPARADGINAELPYTLPASDYHALTDESSTYVNAEGAVGRLNATGVERYLAWDAWRPFPPHSVKIDVRNGAGQYRAVGRVMMLADLQRVSQRVQQAVAAARNPEVAGELVRVQKCLGAKDPALTPSSPAVYVIASVAGGSGSGGVLDVCDILRGHGITSTTALLFTPEVFEHDDGSLDPGIAPNTFMALNELANAMWVQGPQDAPDAREILFGRSSVISPVDYAGPDTVFLVGRRNASVTLGNTAEIYQVMGRALAEVATNEELDSDLTAYMRGNSRQNVAGVPDTLPLSVPGAPDLAQFRALGFSRVSIGRDVFRTYTTDRLERLVILRLLDRHLERRQPGDRTTDEDLLREAVEEQWPLFLASSGLNERGRNANDVTTMLDSGPTIRSEVHDWQSRTASEIRGKAEHRFMLGNMIKIGVACEVVSTTINQLLAQNSLRAQAADTSITQAIAWRQEIQDKLAALVRTTMAEHGLPVAVGLMEMLVDEVDQAVADVIAEGRGRRIESDEQLSMLAAPDPAWPRWFKPDDQNTIDALLKKGRQTLRGVLVADSFEIAGRLLADVHDNLLGPWLHALRESESLLRRAARPEGGQTSVLDVWPRETGIPDYLRPSPVEFLLDDIEKFPEDFGDVIVRSVEHDGGVQNAIDRAVTEIIMGPDFTAPGSPLPAVTYLSAWSPGLTEVRLRGQQPARAKVLIRVTIDDLHDRVRAWISDSERVIGRYLSQSLADYLTDPQVLAAERAARSDKLVAQFSATLRASSPLVALNSSMIQKIHGLARPQYEFRMAPLNIPPSDQALRARLVNAASQIVGIRSAVRFTTDPSQHAQVTTLLDSAHHLIEIDSVMKPMASQWVAHHGNPGFWQWRRTRPVSDWVPLGPNARRALIAGWIVGRLLGLSQHRSVPAGQSPLAVLRQGSWTPVGTGLVRPDRERAALGNLLESLPVTILDAYRADDLTLLSPYADLIRLGAGLRDEDNNAVSRWVLDGTGAGDPAVARLDLTAAEVATRRDAVLQACNSRLS